MLDKPLDERVFTNTVRFQLLSCQIKAPCWGAFVLERSKQLLDIQQT